MPGVSALGKSAIIVVGAGIVGVSTALWLRRGGHEVTLIDREGPAAGTSHGNAGVLAAGSIVPIPVPGLMAKAPRMLLDPRQPLFVKWRHLPRLMPFLRSYLGQGRHVDRIAAGLHDLLHDAVEQHHALADGTPAARYLHDDDWIFGYADRAAYEADAYGWGIRRAHGVPFEEMSAADLAAYDPALAGCFGFGVRMLRHGRITDPGAYVAALMDVFVAEGGRFRRATVTDLRLEDGACTGLVTDAGQLTADRYVLTLGAWSGPLAKALGITVPMESERGYHVEYVNPSLALRGTLMVAAGKFAMNSMEGRLRCAGIVEFGGLVAPASRAPLALLRRHVRDLFPDLTCDRVVEWMGHRPSTADSLPVIGPAPRAGNVLLGYGHQHVGLTGGPKTGRWLAQLAGDRMPNPDLRAFAPDRTIRGKPGRITPTERTIP